MPTLQPRAGPHVYSRNDDSTILPANQETKLDKDAKYIAGAVVTIVGSIVLSIWIYTKVKAWRKRHEETAKGANHNEVLDTESQYPSTERTAVLPPVLPALTFSPTSTQGDRQVAASEVRENQGAIEQSTAHREEHEQHCPDMGYVPASPKQTRISQNSAVNVGGLATRQSYQTVDTVDTVETAVSIGVGVPITLPENSRAGKVHIANHIEDGKSFRVIRSNREVSK